GDGVAAGDVDSVEINKLLRVNDIASHFDSTAAVTSNSKTHIYRANKNVKLDRHGRQDKMDLPRLQIAPSSKAWLTVGFQELKHAANVWWQRFI
ncbi:hypothetical protein C5167_000153, partial [Papaver somniferum]